MADPSADYFAARDQQRQWSDGAMGGYETSGLVGTGRQLRRTRGGSFLHVPSGPGPQTGGGVAKTARYNTEGPAPIVTTDASPQKTGTISYPKAEGVAPNFDAPSPGSGGLTFPTLDKIGNVLATAGTAIAARKRKAMDKAPKPEAPKQGSPAPTGDALPPPTGPAQPGPQAWAPPKASDNLTYTTGNTPFRLGDDPFVGPDTDELGRPLKNAGGGQGGQAWGPPTGAPKHGPIFLGDDPFSGSDSARPNSRTQRRPAGEQPPAPIPPSSRGQSPNVTPIPNAPSAGGSRSVMIDDFANQEAFPDTYELGAPLSGAEELALRRQEVYARRPESSGRVAPGRPGGPGRVAPGRPGGPRQTRASEAVESMIPNETNLALDAEDPMGLFTDNEGNPVPRTQGTSGGMTPPPYSQGQLFDAGPASPSAPPQEEAPAPTGEIPGQRQLPFNRPPGTGRTFAGRPEPTGRTLPNRPGGPRFAAQQRRQQEAQAAQAQVEQAATGFEYPSATAPATNSGNYPSNWNQMTRDQQFKWLKDNGREGEGWRMWRR